MKVEQIYSFVNDAFKETTGQEDILLEDLTNIVDVGKALEATTQIGSNAYDNGWVGVRFRSGKDSG